MAMAALSCSFYLKNRSTFFYFSLTFLLLVFPSLFLFLSKRSLPFSFSSNLSLQHPPIPAVQSPIPAVDSSISTSGSESPLSAVESIVSEVESHVSAFESPISKVKLPKELDSVVEEVNDGDSSGLESRKECNMYEGRWEKDTEGRYPLYEPGSCPYVDDAFTCRENGRSDTDYLKWRWKPNNCEVPRFNATRFLERLRGKRLMLVGDSMNRNQFESMLCVLREALPDKSKVYETRGYKISKGRGYFIFLFVVCLVPCVVGACSYYYLEGIYPTHMGKYCGWNHVQNQYSTDHRWKITKSWTNSLSCRAPLSYPDYNCTVEFIRSHFLAREGTRVNGQGNSNPILEIDRIDKSAKRWKNANILVFNTGHWWAHGKTTRGKNYYKEGGVVYPQFDATEAFKRAMKTWGRWIDENINHTESLVFYRGYSTAHFRGGDWDSGGTCNGETEPALKGPIVDSYPLRMKIVEEVINEMKSPVFLLNVTKLTNFRKDAHPSIYGHKLTPGQKVSRRRQDCSHWCLPGVPDAWNELIYATLELNAPRIGR